MSDLKQQQKQNQRIRKECEDQRQDMKDQRDALTIQRKQQADANLRKMSERNRPTRLFAQNDCKELWCKEIWSR